MLPAGDCRCADAGHWKREPTQHIVEPVPRPPRTRPPATASNQPFPRDTRDLVPQPLQRFAVPGRTKYA
jgi:hypothetical protein